MIQPRLKSLRERWCRDVAACTVLATVTLCGCGDSDERSAAPGDGGTAGTSRQQGGETDRAGEAAGGAETAGASGVVNQGPEVLAFESTGCKALANLEQGGSLGVASDQPASDEQPLILDEGIDPLLCVSWERAQDGTLDVSVRNFHAKCLLPDASWEPRVATPDTTMQLTIEQPSCLVGVCGWCLYDASVKIAGAEAVSSLEVAVAECLSLGQEARDLGSIDISGSSGLACRYGQYSAVMWGYGVGVARAPCGEVMEETVTCESGTDCVNDVDPSGGLCLPTCNGDTDCASVETCRDGHCIIAETW